MLAAASAPAARRAARGRERSRTEAFRSTALIPPQGRGGANRPFCSADACRAGRLEPRALKAEQARRVGGASALLAARLVPVRATDRRRIPLGGALPQLRLSGVGAALCKAPAGPPHPALASLRLQPPAPPRTRYRIVCSGAGEPLREPPTRACATRRRCHDPRSRYTSLKDLDFVIACGDVAGFTALLLRRKYARGRCALVFERAITN